MTDTTKVHLGDPVSFIGGTYRNMSERSPQHGGQLTRLGRGSTLHSLKAAHRWEYPFQVPLLVYTSSRKLAGSRFLQAAGLVSDLPLHLGSIGSEETINFYCLVSQGAA